MNLDELLFENPTPLMGYSQKAIFVMGPPGSGKNTIIDTLFRASDFKLEDFDEVMMMYKQLPSSNKDEYKHSYHLMTQRRNLWLKGKHGLIINTTGRRLNNVVELKKLLEENGYDTFGLFVKVSYDLALHRINQRPDQAQKPADKGRKVDTDYFDKAYVASIANLKLFKSVFGDVNFSVIINDPDSQYYQPSLDNASRNIKRFLKTTAKS